MQALQLVDAEREVRPRRNWHQPAEYTEELLMGDEAYVRALDHAA